MSTTHRVDVLTNSAIKNKIISPIIEVNRPFFSILSTYQVYNLMHFCLPANKVYSEFTILFFEI